MSVLIRGMEMPGMCLKCPFMISKEDDDCILQSDEANTTFRNWGDMRKNCPLVEVSAPHGRLIDADALNTDDMVDVYIGGDLYRHEWSVDEWINSAPTIIQAEEN